MIYQYYKNQMFHTSFAAILTIVLLGTSDTSVKSQRAVETGPPPMTFDRLPAPNGDISSIISAGTSPGSLIEKWAFDFGTSEGASAVAVQVDGKIVAAGTVHVSGDPGHLYSDRDFVVFRYNADGSLDTTFDGDGKLTTAFGDGNDSASTIAIQTDGKIVAAGLSITINGSIRSALVRYNTDGSLDPSFGADGKVVTAGLSITDIALQPDGKIVAARGWNGFSVARYNGDGSLDASFGTGGIATTEFGGNFVNASSVAIQADGRIVTAGNAGFCDKEGCSSNFALARYNVDGSPDTSFDSDGRLTTSFSNYDFANEVVVQTDGRIVAAGHAFGLAVVRYNGDGSLDNSFDGDGRVTIGSFGANSAALQSDGKIIVCGTGGDFALSRLNSDGSLDTSFDGDGMVTTDFGGWDVANDVAILPNGRIVTVGNTRTGPGFESPNDDFALARYNTDGSLDASLDADGKQTSSWIVRSSAATAVVIPRLPGTPYNIYYVGYSTNDENDDFAIARDSGGKLITPIGDFHDRAYAAAFGPDLKIVAVGSSENGSNTDFALVRYNGLAVDTSFDGDGKVTTDFGGSNDEAKAVFVQADGKIVVAGQTLISGNAALAIARYNTNGSLDASFGTGGKVVLQSIQNPTAMAVQVDGKILVGGRVGQDFAIARLNTNGSLDTTFDSDGVAVTTFGIISQINSIALQPFGKIVAAGFIFDFDANSTDFALARYNADGSPDMSFDGDGKVTTSFNTSSAANAVSVQRNGKIVAVGSASTNSALDFALARYNLNGSLDTTFDTDGKQTTDFFGGDDISFGSTLDQYGSLIVVGSASREGRTDFAVARYTGDPQRKVAYDFDDDGVAELSVFRPSNGAWYLNRSTLGFYATVLGNPADKITPADYDADGKTDVAVYRDGLWFMRTSRFSTNSVVHFGLPDDIPVPADYFGDERAEIAIYRGGEWWTLDNTNGEAAVVQFGIATDKPVPADYDGDGKTDQAVYRNGEWHINGSSQGYTVIRFGLATDKPLPADYDGDGKADPAVYRDGTWYLLQSTDGFAALQWGLSSDIPVPADYDGDGKTDAAVFRNGTWYLLQTTSGLSIQQFGLPGDTPVPAAYLP